MNSPATAPISRFHKTGEQVRLYMNHSIDKALADGRILQADADLIREFIAEARATAHISNDRAFKLAYTLIGWRQFIGPFHTLTTPEIFAGMDALDMATKADGSPRYTDNTKADYKNFLKRFATWLHENDYAPNVRIEKIRKIRTAAYDAVTKTAEMMLSPDDVRAMIEVCTNSRDRALVALLYEGAFRIGEVATLRWGQVKFSEWNCSITVSFKTKRPRTIPIIMALPYLVQWRNDYPVPYTEDAFVFLTDGAHQQLQYAGTTKQLKRIARRAGIQKHVTPHLLRHSRITNLMKAGTNESIIKKIAWGSLSTKMMGTYLHLADADIEAEMARLAGVEPPAQKRARSTLEPRQCPRCFRINAPTDRFCPCGIELTADAAADMETTVQMIEATDVYAVARRAAEDAARAALATLKK
jgi:integrase